MSKKARVRRAIAVNFIGAIAVTGIGLGILTFSDSITPIGYGWIVLGVILAVVAVPYGRWAANREHDKQEMLEEWRKSRRPPGR